MENLENGKFVVILGKFNCQDYPLNDKAIFISFEDLEKIDPINGSKCFDVENNCVVDYDNTQELENQRLADLRAKREPLLVAFDKYKTNVVYGIKKETEEQKTGIVSWYELLLDLDERAFENVPDEIKYYL